MTLLHGANRSSRGGAAFILLLILVFLSSVILGFLYNPLDIDTVWRNGGGAGPLNAPAGPGPSGVQAGTTSKISPTDDDAAPKPAAKAGPVAEKTREAPIAQVPMGPGSEGIVIINVSREEEKDKDRGSRDFKGLSGATFAELKAERGMDVKEGGHFTVKFDGGENAVAGHLIGLLLEEAYLKVGRDLEFYPEDRIEAVLYSMEQFRDVTRSPGWAGALYDGRIKIPAGGVTEKTDLLEKVIFHEYTHAVVHRLSRGRAPTWLNEGIAQYEEGKDTSGYTEALRGLALERKFRLRQLEGSFMRLDRNSAEAAYVLSLSATSYIIQEFGIFSVRRIFEGLGNGSTLENAVSSALYLSYEDIEKSWLEKISKD